MSLGILILIVETNWGGYHKKSVTHNCILQLLQIMHRLLLKFLESLNIDILEYIFFYYNTYYFTKWPNMIILIFHSQRSFWY